MGIGDAKANSKKLESSSRVSNMLSLYRNQVISSMVTRFNYKNSMQVPKILSISLNMGIGDAKANSKKLESSSRVSNMLSLYRNQVISSMVTRFNYKNSMQVPKILSISLNMGIGDAKANSKKLEKSFQYFFLT
jgi:ribosomal protein L5